MIHWLIQDLKKNDRLWTLVILHHPPYTKGSHDSDDLSDSDGRMAWVRGTLVPIMELGGVDLVLSGHSHGYERSALINGHFGLSNSWIPEMLVSDQTQTKGPLLKNYGTVYLVAGSSSKTGPESQGYNHPAMIFSRESLGSLVIDVGEDRLISRFINQNGEIIDQFSLINRKLDSRSLQAVND
jgi:3',5'-cyclic AMP phosphodiesterase CpdA